MKVRGGGFYITLIATLQPAHQVTSHAKPGVSPLPKKHVTFSPLLSLTAVFYIFSTWSAMAKIAMVAPVI